MSKLTHLGKRGVSNGPDQGWALLTAALTVDMMSVVRLNEERWGKHTYPSLGGEPLW